MIIDVLSRTGEDADHPAAKVRIGIDTGKALAVNNGRHGHREPLFLGEPANHAAKRAGGGKAAGIFLTNEARTAIGLKKAENMDTTSLTTSEIATSVDKAKLEVTADEIVSEWEEDLKKLPIGMFEFSGHQPPYCTSTLKASRRKIRGAGRSVGVRQIWTGSSYVSKISTPTIVPSTSDALCTCLRSGLDAVLHTDFEGRKVRFIGDCVHGLLVEGTAQTTDAHETMESLTLCAGGMRSSFELALTKLKEKGTDATSLGLGIGFDFGPMNVTRLGMKGELIRCSVSRGVLSAEQEQHRCSGTETAIGETAYVKASDAVRALFGTARKRANLTYDVVVKELSGKEDGTTKASVSSSLLKPATAVAVSLSFPNRPAGPAKPDGFA
ncbi:MAG: transcriptional regulator [Chitinophagaceae bacterium]|nr:transcriptional regulator [Chitinophagaceae bacterium]